MFSSLRYFWSEAFKSLFRNQFMAIASVLTVTVSMFILGGFLCVVLNINHMASYLENQVEMTVYLKEGLRTEQVMDVGAHLKKLPGIKEIRPWQILKSAWEISPLCWILSTGIRFPPLTRYPYILRMNYTRQ